MARAAKVTPAPAPLSPVTFTFTIPAMPSPRRKKNPATGRMVIDTSKPPKLKLVGYYTKGSRPDWTRLKEYNAWKDHVRLHIPKELREYAAQDEASRMLLNTVAYFENGTHNDPENVRKAIVDAICTGGDKWAYGYHDHPRYDPDNPRVEVTVTIWLPAQ